MGHKHIYVEYTIIPHPRSIFLVNLMFSKHLKFIIQKNFRCKCRRNQSQARRMDPESETPTHCFDALFDALRLDVHWYHMHHFDHLGVARWSQLTQQVA